MNHCADTVNNFDQVRIRSISLLRLKLRTNGNADGTLTLQPLLRMALIRIRTMKTFSSLQGQLRTTLTIKDIITAVGNVTTTANDQFFLVVNNAGTQPVCTMWQPELQTVVQR